MFAVDVEPLFLLGFCCALPFYLGTIHILRKQRGWLGGVDQMLTIAHMVGGWVKANAYVSKI